MTNTQKVLSAETASRSALTPLVRAFRCEISRTISAESGAKWLDYAILNFSAASLEEAILYQAWRHELPNLDDHDVNHECDF
jgi:hypothetical protein